MTTVPLIFDAHLDLSMNAMEWNRDLRLPLVELRRRELGMQDLPDRGRNTVCLPEMRRGRVGLCVATQIARFSGRFSKLPGWQSPEQAWAQTQGQLAWYRAMEECGELIQLRSWPEVQAHAEKWKNATAEQASTLPVGYLLSLEGADSILSWKHLERSRAEGLIAIGLTHYGPGIYGHGTDDEGPLTPKGRELLKEIERLGIILDVTHLCEESFWDALDRYSGPLWASHHNCRALANWNRQLADDQIRALVERGAVIGMAFDAIMMVHGWVHRRSTPAEFGLKMEKICEHIDHICQIAGNAHHVGFGTDLDGGYGTEQTPMDLDSIADLHKLVEPLSARGYREEDIQNIFHGNFLRFLSEHLQ
ncbi:MAG: membrane dipeptidase [Bryobacteraceae bacterium]|nr:membrane dipeptidase [Bryobacteraceae bacterium]MDW8377191.1 membrane dipeptidase [Bryobacterales bacterium]